MENRTYAHCATVQYGSIYSASGAIIENPALIIDQSFGTLVSWGEKDIVEAKYMAMTSAYAKANLPIEDLILITFDQFSTTREEQCYIIRRCVEYTASGFQTALCHALEENSDPRAWLDAEMAKVPIDVTQ